MQQASSGVLGGGDVRHTAEQNYLGFPLLKHYPHRRSIKAKTESLAEAGETFICFTNQLFSHPLVIFILSFQATVNLLQFYKLETPRKYWRGLKRPQKSHQMLVMYSILAGEETHIMEHHICSIRILFILMIILLPREMFLKLNACLIA